MKVLDCGPTDELFTHIDKHGVTRHWNTSAMVRAVFERKVQPHLAECDLTQGLIDHILQHHGVEERSLATLPEKVLEIPVVLAQFADGTSLLVDGNHRVVRRWRKGLKKVHAMVFSEDQWTPFLVTDVGAEYPVEVVADGLRKLLER